MEPNLFKYIWHHSKGEQINILVMVLVSMPFYFLALDLPKAIVNSGIQGVGFSGPGSTQSFLVVDVPFTDWLNMAPERLFDERRVFATIDAIYRDRLETLRPAPAPAEETATLPGGRR